MTESERCQPELLASQPSRRRRIATGSGHQPADVDKVLADFQKMRGFMQQMSRGNMPGMPGMGGMPGMPGMPGMGGIPGMGGMPGLGGMPAGPGRGAPPKRQRPAKKKKGFGEL
jgi:signal recognition particle subunit SRP54